MGRSVDAGRLADGQTRTMNAPVSLSRGGDRAAPGAVERLAGELKSPLLALTLGAELLRYRAEQGDLDAAGMVRGLARLEEAAATMATLVEALLELARAESGAPPDLQPRLVDLVALVRGVAAGRAARFHSDVPAMLVECDGARLARALPELLERLPNARLRLRGDTTAVVLELRSHGADLPEPPAVLRRLVEAHGGALSAEPGRSAIVLRLPR
jgi:signal transduction histidine kinase